jgi:hypothetical protein
VQDAGVCTHGASNGLSEVWVGLVLNPNVDIGAIRFAIESNVHFKNNVDKIFVVEAVPRGTVGKIQRDQLQKMLQSIAEESQSPR